MPATPGRIARCWKAYGAVTRRTLFWASLLLALTGMTLGYRYSIPASPACIAQVDDLDSPAAALPLTLPLRHAPQHEAPSNFIHRYRFTFQHDASASELAAISIGEAVPFYRLTVNGANLTPAVDLTARDVRDIAPHVHLIAPEVLRDGRNVALLELPAAMALVELRLDQICVGNATNILPAHRANWWRMVGVPTVCTMLFCALIVLAIALWLLSARHPAYAWYIACVVLMLARSIYVSTSARPGTPYLWMTIDNVAIALQPYVLYRFMSAHWQLRLPWLSITLFTSTLAALLCCAYLYVAPGSEVIQSQYVIFLLISTFSSMFAVLSITRGLRALRGVERGVVLWVSCFAYAGGLLEIANLFLPFTQRWMWTAPLAGAALALGFGNLLLRRMALGADLFAQASNTLAQDLDHAIAADQPGATPVWAHVSASIERRERGRLIRDIHDGFGSRLVAVMSRARRELPHSSLHRQLQRALLDMRLMLDAMDEASRSMSLALARLRHRTEPALEAAGITSEWQVDAIDSVRIDDRRKLMGLFRCLEELLSNCVEHSGADRIVIDTTVEHGRVTIRVQDNGRGMQSSQIIAGRGIDRARWRARSIGGTLRLGAARAGPGLLCVLNIPLL